MKKRILCLTMTCIMLVTVFPVFAYAAGAANLSTSDAGLSMIKRFEGFTALPVADGGQYAIGYGHACDPADYPNGITQEEADTLLRETLLRFESSVNQYAGTYGITLKQNQFDALVSMTYNLGTSWINSSYRFWSMLRNGLSKYTDNQIASAIGVWSHVGTTVSAGVMQRRISEIRLFLYGDAAGSQSPDFRYLIFDANGGSAATDVMLYRANEAYGEFPGVARDGYVFSGWYTAKEGGTKLATSGIAAKNSTVYAQWTQNASELAAAPDGFSDVASDDWFYPYVMQLSASGVLDGYSDGTFRPQQAVTVGQALKLICSAAGVDASAYSGTHWADGYRAAALARGWATKDELANLDAPISRAVIAVLAANAMRLDTAVTSSPFEDTGNVYAAALYHAGILEGSVDAAGNRMFYPNSSMKRAELAKLICNLEKL